MEHKLKPMYNILSHGALLVFVDILHSLFDRVITSLSSGCVPEDAQDQSKQPTHWPVDQSTSRPEGQAGEAA